MEIMIYQKLPGILAPLRETLGVAEKQKIDDVQQITIDCNGHEFAILPVEEGKGIEVRVPTGYFEVCNTDCIHSITLGQRIE